MLPFIANQFSLILSIIFVLFAPGFFLLKATRLKEKFGALEIFILSIVSSIATVDFLMLLMGKIGVTFNFANVLSVIFLFGLICSGFIFYNRKHKVEASLVNSSLSRRSTILFILLMFLTVFIKTIYFKDAIFPTATDLGHHMYWTKVITTTGKLPVYEKADIGLNFTIEKPQGIADFIIGEHLIFAAISLISGADLVSAFPALVLFLINTLTPIAIFILARSLLGSSSNRDTIALTTLLLTGPLYALASPQAKFASGGVIGNTIGNLFIPVIIMLFLKALEEKSSKLLAFALFISLGLAYTHHLSTFVFVFISVFTVFFYVALNFKSSLNDFRQWIKLAMHPAVIAVLGLGIIYVFFVYMPTYLNTHAINTAVGAPSKASRAGLTLTQLKTTAGEARFALGVIGILLLLFAKKLGKYRQALLLGWTVSLTLMSLRPDWLLVDIPSNRVASYIVFPAAIVAAYLLVTFLATLRADNEQKSYLSSYLVIVIFVILSVFASTNGNVDNGQALNLNSSANRAIQTYRASDYLAKHSNDQDIILKDHNYLAGDSWIKLAFMRGYNYPLSRGYFKRYEDTTKNREQCTNLMISEPNNPQTKQCYEGTKTDYLMVNPKFDSAQFHRLNEFWQVYASDEVGIFYKTH